MATGTSRDLAHQLSRAERLLSGRVSAILAREECTVEEWRVLKFLSDGHGHALAEIADFAMLPEPDLTELVDRLTAEGLLYRRESSGEKDALAYLSLQGRDRYEGAAEQVSAAEAELSDAVGDQGELAGWLERLCGVLAIPPQPGPAQSQARNPGRDNAISPSPNG